MPILKRLIFAPIFLITFGVFIVLFRPLLSSYDFIFSFSTATLIQLITISGIVSISSFLFILISTLASDWRISLPVGIAASAIPFLFLDISLGFVFAVSILVSLMLISLTLDSSSKSYLNFQPSVTLGPFIRHLSSLLILAFCLIYFLSSNKIIAQDGFQIPDSLIDTALKMTPLPESNTEAQTSLPQLSKVIQAPADLMKDTIKQTVKDQIQNFIKPYQSFIPAILAVLLFLTLQSLTSFINLLIYPLLWITFLILEKTGFIKFEIETRQVKKLVV